MASWLKTALLPPGISTPLRVCPNKDAALSVLPSPPATEAHRAGTYCEREIRFGPIAQLSSLSLDTKMCTTKRAKDQWSKTRTTCQQMDFLQNLFDIFHLQDFPPLASEHHNPSLISTHIPLTIALPKKIQSQDLPPTSKSRHQSYWRSNLIWSCVFVQTFCLVFPSR